MSLVFGGIAPHPPIMIPEVGLEEARKVAKSQEAMARLAEELKMAGAETLVVISPHSPVFRDAIAVNLAPELSGDLGNFGVPQVKVRLPNDLALAQAISAEAARREIVTVGLDKKLARSYGTDIELDHGVLVPLYFLQKAGINLPMVSMAMAPFLREKLYSFGVAIREASEKLGRKIAFLASGDLSHRLLPEAPAGYDPEGENFDRQVVEAVSKGDIEALLKLPAALLEKAGECGYRPILMLFGAFDGWEITTEVLSYEGPFGVGYMVATLKPLHYTGESLLDKIAAGEAAQRAKERAQKAKERAEESPFVKMARESLEHYLRTGKYLKAPSPVPPEMQEEAGVFVSLKKHGELRGCIGTIAPTTPNIAEEIIRNAVSAGTGDPRFWPVEEDELEELVFSVDVLKPAEAIESLEELDPKRYGVIVRKGRRSGLLLPNLEGIDTAEEQVAIARQKAGIAPGEEMQLERFEVIRHK